MPYYGYEEGSYFLAHYGVIGMRWGVRHDPESTGNSGFLSRRRKKRAERIQKKRKEAERQRNEYLYKNGDRLAKKYPDKVKKFKSLSVSYLALTAAAVNRYNSDQDYKKKVTDHWMKSLDEGYGVAKARISDIVDQYELDVNDGYGKIADDFALAYRDLKGLNKGKPFLLRPGR